MKAGFYLCHEIVYRNALLGLPYPESLNVKLFSEKFCLFFSECFEKLFIEQTGIPSSSKVGIAPPNRFDSPPIYEFGIVSKINPVLWILPDYYDDISFCWKSKSGKIVKPTDENFDVSDLEFWLEGIKPQEYWRQVASKKKVHPFLSKNIPFELIVYRFSIDILMRITFNDLLSFTDLEFNITSSIKKYNEMSEKKDRHLGVVHNFNFKSKPGLVILNIDTGSAGVSIINEIIRNLKTLSGIQIVEVDI